MTSEPVGEAIKIATTRDQLRASTSSLHQRVDASFTKLLHEPGGYGHFLSVIAAGLLPLERALENANVVAILPDWPQRSRSAALLSDLSTLSLPVPAPRTIPEKTLLCVEAYQFGILYVLEGSRLGARVLLREREKSGQQKYATEYLSHGEGKPLWQTFLARLEDSRAARNTPATVEAGALAAFKLFLAPEDTDLNHYDNQ